ncbi:FecR family protein [Odoribacter sp. AF15-53]|uniref:FecR family protein n=1 Tax=Odoribacter sp. AF15-53 TaxID=2292236 RepID=UPI000E4DDC8C|nr:FecR domain-containing protein [Odoribacter sp. AF15-53]RHR75458.1 FecR family protein [Odoribacter sp. AF15-53]
MDDYHYRIIELIKCRFTGEITREEETELSEWIRRNPSHQVFFDMQYMEMENRKREEVFAEIDEERALRFFERKIGYRHRVFVRRWFGYVAAVAACAIVMFMLYLPGRDGLRREQEPVSITAGKKQATLILSGGQSMVLGKQDTLNEILVNNGVKALDEEGLLIYQDNSDKVVKQQYNELVTPRGGEFRVTLSDGTVVYLNADTRLRYPVTFVSDKREVHLSGEAYFEVTKDTLRPFHVITDDVNVKVYGTAFSVNTHRKGIVRTTLVNGKVGVTIVSTGQEMMMRPNQMLEYDSGTGSVRLEDVDVYTYTAWKSGEFVFVNDRLEEIMEQLSIWYDAKVFYANEKVKNLRFTGDATRFTEIKDILSILEKTGSVVFEMNGRTITVYGKE